MVFFGVFFDKRYCLWLMCFCLGSTIYSQTAPLDTASNQINPTYSLEQCIDIAQANSLELKSNQLSITAGSQMLASSKLRRLPSLGFFASHQLNFGRAIDPSSYSFATENFQSSSFSLQSDWTLYEGGKQNSSIARNRLALKNAEIDQEILLKDISVRVASAFLQVALAEEQGKVSALLLDQSQRQWEITSNLIEAGQLARVDLLEIESQIANEEIQIEIARSNLQLAKSELAALMNLDPFTTFEIVSSTSTLDEYIQKPIPDGQALYQEALVNLPSYKRKKDDIKLSELEIKVTRANLQPKLSLSANANTTFSELRTVPTSTLPSEYVATGLITSSFDPVLSPNFETETQNYFDQLQDNLTQGVGLNLSIPLFQKGLISEQVQLQRINLQQSKLALDIYEQQLMNEVFRVVTEAQAARSKYVALQRLVYAAEKSLEAANEKYRLKILTPYELGIAKNNLARAQSELLSAKFDLIFKITLIHFYRGEDLKF